MNKIIYYWHPNHGIYTGSLIDGARKATEAEVKEHENRLAQEVPHTQETLMSRLDNELQLQMGELNQAFVAAQIRKDAALQNELRKELEEIEAWYQEMQEKIKQGENPWEGE